MAIMEPKNGYFKKIFLKALLDVSSRQLFTGKNYVIHVTKSPAFLIKICHRKSVIVSKAVQLLKDLELQATFSEQQNHHVGIGEKSK